jgi:hypothetical protein
MVNCSVDGCVRPVLARGWCRMHYQRWRRHRDVTKGPRDVALCAVEGCERLAKIRGWCPRHYERWRLYGDPLAFPTEAAAKISEARLGGHLTPLTKAKMSAAHRIRLGTAGTSCLVSGCSRPLHAKGLCHLHYDRRRRNGDPMRARAYRRRTDASDRPGRADD